MMKKKRLVVDSIENEGVPTGLDVVSLPELVERCEWRAEIGW